MNIQTNLDGGDFVSLAREEMEIFHKLLELAELKKSVLISGKLAGLDKIVQAEEELLFSLSELQAKRDAFLEKESQTTLSGMAGRFCSETSSEILNLKAKWLQTIFELADLQRQNQRLLENAMNVTRIRFKSFMKWLQENRYSKNGEQVFYRGPLLLNRTA